MHPVADPPRRESEETAGHLQGMQPKRLFLVPYGLLTGTADDRGGGPLQATVPRVLQ